MRFAKRGQILAAILAMGPGLAVAQYHQKTKSGETMVRPESPTQVIPPNSAAGGGRNTPPAYSGNRTVPGTPLAAASIPSTKAAPRANTYASVWGYAIHHSDGSYTRSKQDYETHQLTQETYSKNGTLILTRKISIDSQGRPSEVMIYNGYGEFRYRGVLIYDRLGRVQEELIFDTRNTMLRKRIQEFDAEGKPQMKVIDLTDKIPEDLQLVVSEKKEIDPKLAKQAMKDFQEQATPVRKDSKEGERTGGEESGEKKRGFFRRIFRGKS